MSKVQQQYCKHSKTNKVKIMFLNIRSLLNKFDDLQVIIKQNNITIVVLNEVRLYEEETVLFNIPNYSCIFNCRTDENRGGGTAIYLKNNIIYNIIACDLTFNMILINIKLDKQHMNLFTMYRPPNSSNFKCFIENLGKIVRNHKNLLMISDFNVNLLQNTAMTIEYRNLLEDNGFRILNQISNEYATRITNTTATLLDHAITDVSALQFPEGCVHLEDVSLSDHRLLLLDWTTNNTTKSKFITKIFNRFNQEIYINQVNSKLESREHHPSIEELLKIITDAKNVATVKIKKRVREEAAEWMTLEIIKLMEKMEKMFKKYKINPSEENYRQYKTLDKNIKLKITTTKTNNFNNKVRGTYGDTRKLWRVINETVLNKTKKASNTIAEIMTPHGQKTSNSYDIANILNEYFLHFAKTLRSNSHSQRLQNVRNPSTMFIEPVTAEEIKTEILKLKNNSSPGIDNITPNDLKLIIDKVSKILALLINEFINNACFPSSLKKTKVIPIHKGGSKDSPYNYRPISLIPVIGKLYEKILNKRLISFIESTTELDKNQFGFQKRSSTDAALCQVIHNINKYLDKGEYVLVLFIDLRKAFDLVDHDTLFEILEELGCRGHALNLFKSYLDNRKVSTQINNKFSEELCLEDGVPQGSVLGPTLYLLYINSLRHLPTIGEQTIYADDTCFLYHSKNKDYLKNSVINDMDIYLQWLIGSKLVINMTKTNYIIFRSRNKPDIDINISTNDFTLERVPVVKYLGVYLDEKLTWEQHIENIRKKIDPLIAAIRRCSKFQDETAMLIYNAHILSKVRPNILIWSICNKEMSNKVQVLLNRSLKALLRLNWFTSLDELTELTNTFTLDELIMIERTKFIYKFKNNLIKTNFEILRNNNVHNYPTRNNDKLRMFISRTSNLLNGILNESIIVFNKLPVDIRNSRNFNIFVTKLKLFVRNQRL